MKKIQTIIFISLLIITVQAQAPYRMNHQEVVRNTFNEPVVNTQIGLRVSILQGSDNGPVVYCETHTPVTNANGLVSFEIGTGSQSQLPNSLDDIDWSYGPYFLKTETDPTGGTNYSITGTSQISSVPYALHARTAETCSGTIREADPVFEASVAGGITGNDVANWNNKQIKLKAQRGLAISGNMISIDTTYFTALPGTWPKERQRGANIVTRITQEDINHFVNDWGGNSVRILVNDLVPPPPAKPDPAKVDAVYRTIDMCLEAGLYTILSFSPSFGDNDAFFSNESYMNAYAGFWQQVAGRYANDTRGVAWDLMNEPHDNLANTRWLPYAKKLISAIRETDTLHTIVIEPPGWGWPYGYEHMQPVEDKNVVYSFHFYGPMDFTHQRNNGMLGATEQQWLERKYPGYIQGEYWDKETIRRYLKQAFEWAEKYGVRMWCGEFGCTRWAVGAEQWIRDIISIMEEEKIGWSWYAYREWYPMDIEMDPAARLQRTDRSETPLVKYFKELFMLGGK